MKTLQIATLALFLGFRPAAAQSHPELVAEPGGAFVLEVDRTGSSRCRTATEAEARTLERRPAASLRVITPPRSLALAATGFHITLRSTAQLDAYPDAKAAFLRAAAFWESKIASAVSVIVDVDYGPTRFGDPWPSPNILGSTASQLLRGTNIWPDMRSAFVATANGATEAALMGQLPSGSVPTSIGSTATVVVPSAPLRALGIIGPNADPNAETDYGAPPSIGFNSSFTFDFNPDDGITAGAIDFNAVAVHELGHALGFASNVGSKELVASNPVALSTLDVFRFQPGQGPANFSGASRVLSSGGSQVFWAGGAELPMSTGRPDGSGGDGNQASHWKANELTGVYIGIMDPTMARGEKGVVTDNDLAAFEALGWAMSGGSTTPLTCTADATTLCLSSARFQVQADYRDYGGNTGSGQAVALTGDSGYFWFFSASNVELVVKMVSFCNGSSGNYGFYGSGLTDVDVTFKVTDTKTGLYKEYRNPLGNRFTTIADGPFTCP